MWDALEKAICCLILIRFNFIIIIRIRAFSLLTFYPIKVQFYPSRCNYCNDAYILSILLRFDYYEFDEETGKTVKVLSILLRFDFYACGGYQQHWQGILSILLRFDFYPVIWEGLNRFRSLSILIRFYFNNNRFCWQNSILYLSILIRFYFNSFMQSHYIFIFHFQS